MQTPLTIAFRHVDRSAAVESRVRDLVTKLERLCDRITGCHVVIERPSANHVHGSPFVAKIELALPGRELFASNAHHVRHEYQDIYAALNDAFDRAKRQLHDFVAHATPQ